MDEHTPLHVWLGDWLQDAKKLGDGTPYISLFCTQEIDLAWKDVFVKAYLPREGRIVYDR